jgi:dihydroorotase
MTQILFKEAKIVNRGRIVEGDLLIQDGRIAKIDTHISAPAAQEIAAAGRHLMPGIIDDQVHFREPGLTHKGDIFSESRAAVAGGVTSYMEMPNVKPPTLTQALLAEKYAIGAARSLANYSFFMGVSNDNLEEVLKTNPRDVCGIKAFMGSSTGNMLVDDDTVLRSLFAKAPMLIATHCEYERLVKNYEAQIREEYGENVPFELHPEIRDVQVCYFSSSYAVSIAKEFNTRLHILHISTADELDLFQNELPLPQKRITSEACVHHLYFSADDYAWAGSQIKCNPAIKEARHREAIFQAVLDDRIDIIATDHAPHTWEEKQGTYFKAPSGLPLVQHTFNIMLDFYHRGMISLEKIVEKMCHAPAQCFQIAERGYLDEGAWADVVMFDLDKTWTVSADNLRYKCAWSPLMGKTFKGAIEATVVSGHLAYFQGQILEGKMGERLTFECES